MLEAWLAPDVPPEDGRVASAAGCWALVDGRVPGASEGVLLRLHADYGGERTWQPLHLESVEEVDSLLVRLAGAVELRLQLQGDRLSGVSQRAGPAGTAGIMVEFARVRCDDVR